MTLKELLDFLKEKGITEDMEIKDVQIFELDEIKDLDVKIEGNKFSVE